MNILKQNLHRVGYNLITITTTPVIGVVGWTVKAILGLLKLFQL